MTRRIAVAFALVLSLSGLAYAHGGEPHIQGTVVTITDTTLVVKTRAGKSTSIALGADTKILRGKERTSLQDVKPGERIVVHPMKHDGQLMAGEIELAPRK